MRRGIGTGIERMSPMHPAQMGPSETASQPAQRSGATTSSSSRASRLSMTWGMQRNSRRRADGGAEGALARVGERVEGGLHAVDQLPRGLDAQLERDPFAHRAAGRDEVNDERVVEGGRGGVIKNT